MKVILKEYVYKHGVAGDIVDVANGYARNFLLPRGLAVRATEAAIEANQGLLEQATIRRNELNEKLVEVANKIEGTHLIFGRKAGSNGKLYGSVTTMDIADKLLEKTEIDINRRRISESALRELGTFPVTIRMGQELAPKVKVTIVREEDLNEYLAQAEESDDMDLQDIVEAEEDAAGDSIAELEAAAEEQFIEPIAEEAQEAVAEAVDEETE